MSIPLLTWWVPTRTVHHTQSDKRLGRSVFQCSEECCILHFLLGPAFQNHHHPKKRPNLTNIKLQGQTMITVLPCARKLLEQDIPTFICQSKSLSISASTSNLNDSVAKEHFNLKNRSNKKFSKKLCFKTLQTFLNSYDSTWSLCPAWAKNYPAMFRVQHCYTVTSSCVSKQMQDMNAESNICQFTSHPKKETGSFWPFWNSLTFTRVWVPKPNLDHSKTMCSHCLRVFCYFSFMLLSFVKNVCISSETGNIDFTILGFSCVVLSPCPSLPYSPRPQV